MGRVGDAIRKKAKQMGRAVTSAIGAKKDFDAEKTSKKTLAAVKQRAEETARDATYSKLRPEELDKVRRRNIVERAERAMTTNEETRQKLETAKIGRSGPPPYTFIK
jgi:hypothetical protein